MDSFQKAFESIKEELEEREKQLTTSVKEFEQMKELYSIEQEEDREKREKQYTTSVEEFEQMKEKYFIEQGWVKVAVGEANGSLPEGIPSVVKLNVGGKIFMTTHSTLTSHPNSMLGAMFSGRYPLNKDEDGAYFLDTNPKTFEYILNYLRRGKTYAEDDDIQLRNLVHDQMLYFGLIQPEIYWNREKCSPKIVIDEKRIVKQNTDDWSSNIVLNLPNIPHIRLRINNVPSIGFKQ